MKELIAAIVAFTGVFLIASSCLHIGKHPLHLRRLALGIALLFFVAAFVFQVANAPPTPGPTDIDDRAVTIARAGLYSDTIEADTTTARLEQHFVKEGQRYRLDVIIKRPRSDQRPGQNPRYYSPNPPLRQQPSHHQRRQPDPGDDPKSDAKPCHATHKSRVSSAIKSLIAMINQRSDPSYRMPHAVIQRMRPTHYRLDQQRHQHRACKHHTSPPPSGDPGKRGAAQVC